MSILPRWARVLHRWGGAVIALPLLLVVVTGLLLTLKKELDWVQPPSRRGSSDQMSLSLEEILASAKTVPEAHVGGWQDISRIDVRPSKGLAKVQANNSYEIQVDTHTGKVLQVAYRRSDLIESLHDGSFFSSAAKYLVFFPAGVILAGLLFSGIYLFALPYSIRARRRRRAGLVAR